MLLIIYQLRKKKFNHYFPPTNTAQYDWIKNPFVETTTEFNLTLTEEEELAGLFTDRELRIKHNEISIEAFWIPSKKNMSHYQKRADYIITIFNIIYM